MPPLPFASSILRIRLSGVFNTNNWASIQYCRYNGAPPTSGDLNTFCTALRTAWVNAIAPITPTTCSLRVVEAFDLSSEIAPTGINSGTTSAGTRAGNSNANQVAMVASYKINRRYRGGHPRTYWPAGVASDTINGSTWTSTFLPIAINGASGWVGNVNAIQLGGAAVQHGCLSYFQRDPNNPGHSMLRAVPQFFPTQSVTVHSRIDTQRRRLGKELV